MGSAQVMGFCVPENRDRRRSCSLLSLTEGGSMLCETGGDIFFSRENNLPIKMVKYLVREQTKTLEVSVKIQFFPLLLKIFEIKRGSRWLTVSKRTSACSSKFILKKLYLLLKSLEPAKPLVTTALMGRQGLFAGRK